MIDYHLNIIANLPWHVVMQNVYDVVCGIWWKGFWSCERPSL